MKKVVVLFILVMMMSVYADSVTYDDDSNTFTVENGDKTDFYEYVEMFYPLGERIIGGVTYTAKYEGDDWVGYNGQQVWGNDQDRETFSTEYNAETGEYTAVQVYPVDDGWAKCTSSDDHDSCGTGSYKSTVVKSQDDIRQLASSVLVKHTGDTEDSGCLCGRYYYRAISK